MFAAAARKFTLYFKFRSKLCCDGGEHTKREVPRSKLHRLILFTVKLQTPSNQRNLDLFDSRSWATGNIASIEIHARIRALRKKK